MSDVTASDVAALFGCHPYGRTALSVWAEKQGLTEGLADSATLRRGRWGEPAVLAMLADERPTWTVRPAKVYLRDRAVRLGATPDAEAVDLERHGLGVVQCKMVAESVDERESTDGAPPLGFQLQTLSEMTLDGAAWGAIAALVMSAYEWRPVIFDLERHQAAEARIRGAVSTFWANFEAGLMPVLDPERDSETISRIYPKAEIKAPPLTLAAITNSPACCRRGRRSTGLPKTRRSKSKSSKLTSRRSWACMSARSRLAGASLEKRAAQGLCRRAERAASSD